MSDVFNRLKGESQTSNKKAGHASTSQIMVSSIDDAQAIDFKKLLQEHRQRTEVSLPYTIMQVEDVMFINDRKLVALEYIFYQKKGKYSRIVADDGHHGHTHFFGTEDYMKHVDPLSAFKQEPQNFHDSKIDYLKEHKQTGGGGPRKSVMPTNPAALLDKVESKLQQSPTRLRALHRTRDKFIETMAGTDAVVEGLLTLWNITKNGQLSQIKEVRINFHNMKFQSTRDGKMMLQLSNDHKLITLAQEDPEKKEVRLHAWHSDSLRPLDLPPELHKNLSRQSKGKLREISLVNSNNHVLMVKKMTKNLQPDEEYLKYFIFERATGRKIIEFSNHSDTAAQLQNPDIRCLGLLIKEPNQEEPEDEEYYDENDEEEEIAEDAEEEAEEEQDEEGEESDPAHEGGDMAGEVEGLEIGFFFVADPQEEGQKKDKYRMFCMTMDLDTLKDYYNDNDGLIYYANVLAKNHFSTEGDSKSFDIPKSWFVNHKNEEEPWQGQIQLAANSTFKQFGLLNKKKHQYLAFEQSKFYNEETGAYEEKYEEIDSQYVPESSIARLGRNQQTKKFLILTLRALGVGSTAYCFFAKGQRRTIKFSADHLQASQDTIVQSVDSRLDDPDFEIHDQYLLQSVSISKGDQEIFLKTQVLGQRSSHHLTNENRTSITQVHQGSFPIIAYNLGQKKLAIQNTIGECKQLIYELPPNEQFVNFVEFNDYSDVGFHSGDLHIECASGFVFLVKNMHKKEFQVNFLFVDPYKPDVQLALFKSSKTIHLPKKKAYQDTIIKSFMYCTRKNKQDLDYEVKLLNQYPNALLLAEMLDIEDGEESSINTDASQHDRESEADEDEEDSDQSTFNLCKNPILLDRSNYLHYVVSHDGMCYIKEINPTNDSHHLVVMEIKSERCYGLSQHGDSLYFLDDFKNIIKLDRQKVSRLLEESGQLHIKDRDLPNFKPTARDTMIVTDKYLIQESKIFFLFQNKPLMNGILDMEQLSEYPDNVDSTKEDDDKIYANGPFEINGCDDFFLVYKYGQAMTYNLRLQALPDSSSTTLLSDFQKKVDLTTFLDDGQILLKIASRFLLFDENGHFVDEVEHKDNHQQAAQMANTTLQRQSVAQNTVESPEIPESDRMILLSMSKTNRYFVFYDRRFKIYKVYEIVMQEKEKKITAKSLRKEQINYAFEPVFEFDPFESYLVKTVLNLSPDTEKDVEEVERMIKTDAIQIILSVFSEKVEVILSHSRHEPDKTQIDIYGAKFNQQGEIKNFMQRMEFDSNAKHDINQIIIKEENRVKNLLKIEEKLQKRLPKNFQNSALIDKYEYKLDQLQVRRYNVVQSHIFHDFVIVQCGRFIKYGQITEEWFNDDIESANDFKSANIDFDQTVEITKVFSTSDLKVYQIIAKDTEKNVLIILTWDFERDIEVSMLQVPCDGGLRPENYIVRGMNQKMNYFINKHQIFDLEFNIPMQQVTNNSLQSKGVSKKFYQQRKIFEDSSRYLKIDKPNILEFPITRMDIEFWEDITDYGEDPEQINLNTELSQFNQIFNGISLFHYFATNLEVIEMLHKKFQVAKQEELLTEAEENMSLVILNPDNNGHSALQIALQKQRPKCFELMIGMLEGYSGFCITKMMLHNLQDMINHGSEIVVKFFDTCTFQPLLMQQALIVPWPHDLGELIFASGSSLISPDLLIQRMSAKIEDFDKILEEFVMGDKEDDASEKQGLSHVRSSRNTLRSWKLGSCAADSQLMQRVKIEAMDFDWVFREDNTKAFIKLLARCQNSKIFVQKSVRCFVEYMWSYYQKEIFQKIFLPYCVYMLCNVVLATSFSLHFLDHIEEQRFDGWYWFSKVTITALSVISGVLWTQFIRQEYRQLKQLQDGGHSIVGHFVDFWNLLDLCSLLITAWFLIELNACAAADSLVFTKPQVRETASICCFLLWVKVFYWMRLFKATAPFLSLILQTLKDVRVFVIMLAIIIMAFANFFYILNANTPANEHNREQLKKDGDFSYLEAHTGYGIADAIIGVFLISLGEFNFDGYAKGPDRIICWVFFLMAIYLLLLVFMNMLIAIMGETFAQVQEIKDELALQEQIAMISDHDWLFDLKKKFAHRRHILRICPDLSLESGAPDVSEEIQDLGQNINKKNDDMLTILLQRLDGLDKTNRQLAKTQAAQSEKFNKISKIVEEQHQKELQKAREERHKQENEKVE